MVRSQQNLIKSKNIQQTAVNIILIFKAEPAVNKE